MERSGGADDFVGATIGRFRIIRLIGSGGMGSVYEAEQDQPRRRVALKVMRFGWADASTFRRFAREVELLGRLQHPSIAPVHDAGVAQWQGRELPFFTMEYVRGRTLSQWLKDERRPLATTLELMARIAEGVDHAHARGVVHRDLKPGNVLVDESGAPKIIDFGLARDDESLASTPETEIGQVLGTIPYMSPEQFAGDSRQVDARTDVYAIGAMLYEALSGKPPFDLRRKTLAEAARIVATEEPSQIGSMHRELRGDVETIVQKALEKDRTRRYASAAELAADLRRYLRSEPISARPASAMYQLEKFARRNKALVAGIAATLLTLVLGIVGTTLGLWRATAARDAAVASAAEARFQAYVAQIGAAGAALGAHDVVQAAARLDACDASLRHWEWRYLTAHLDQSAEVLAASPASIAVPSPDGTKLAVVQDGELRTIDIATRAVTAVSRSVPPTVRDIAWSRDSGRLAIANASGAAVTVFALSTGDAIVLPTGHVDEVDSLAFSPDGTIIATGSKDGSVRVIDAETGNSIVALRGLAINATVAFTPDARFLLAAGTGGAILWSCSGFTQFARYAVPDLTFGEAALSPDGALLAIAAADGSVRVVDTFSGNEVKTLQGDRSAALGVSFSADGAFIAARTADRVVRIWDKTTGLARTILRGHRAGLSGVRFDPVAPWRLFSSGADGIRSWDLRILDDDIESREHCGDAWAPVYSDDGQKILTSGLDRTTRLWGGKDLEARGPFFGRLAPADAKAVHPNGRHAAVATTAGPVLLWDLDENVEVAVLEGPGSEVKALGFSEDGRRLLAVSNGGGELCVFDWETQKLLDRSPGAGAFGAAVILPGGERWAFASADGDGSTTVVVRDVAGRRADLRLAGHAEPVTALDVSRDGRRLLVNRWSRTDRRLWDLETGHAVGVITPIIEDVRSAALTPDAQRIAFGLADGSIEIHDAVRLAPIVSLRVAAAPIGGLAFSPDGAALCATTSIGAVKLLVTETRAARLTVEAAARTNPAESQRRAKARERAKAGSIDGLFERAFPILLDRSRPAADHEWARETISAMIFSGRQSSRFLLAYSVGCYRRGQFALALTGLDQASNRLTAEEDDLYRVAILAFRSMALWRIHKEEDALDEFDALVALMKTPGWASDALSKAAFTEAEAIVGK